VVAQEEEHVRRIWVEVGALRRGNAERIGEMEDKLNSAHPESETRNPTPENLKNYQ
jgi:hypothetical protein